MYQFFVADTQIAGETVTIEGEDVKHIRSVLRMRPGEQVRVSSENGRNYYCELTEITERLVLAHILREDTAGTELPCRVYLFQGLPKNDKMELIIQKAVELGVYEVIPVAMKNCVVKLDEKKASAKAARWQEIAKSAAKQSKRSLIPRVSMPVNFRQAVERAEELDVRLVPYENERGMDATREVLSSIRPGQSVGILIGPEGGFAPEEIAMVQDTMHLISLGNRILRTETAGFTALAFLIYEIEGKE
ncbi:MAG: 16S rRNA (uracil(1498)-N(3))-methyltransferase [Roseburia sp.]